jgi:hypothetical protein
MQVSSSQALEALNRNAAVTKTQPDLLIAGATGVLGNAVLRRLVGVHRYAHTLILAREPVQQGMRTLSLHLVAGKIAAWPVDVTCDVAAVMFEPPRMYYERERALWTPEPAQLTALAAWLHACGARTLAVVMPHAQGTLPESLKRGLASLDEQALAALGFDRLLILRSAEKPAALLHTHVLDKLAHWMLGIFKFMIPAQEQPVRPTKIAEIVDALLQTAPRGTSVIAPQEMWELSQCKSEDLCSILAKQWPPAADKGISTRL